MDGKLVNYLPTALCFQFEPDFALGMRRVYEGFYLENEEMLKTGMRATGLLKQDASDESFEQSRQALFKYFGTALSEKQLFSTKQFRNSFQDLFRHLKQHEIQLHADFVILGVYLATLYQALEALGQPLDVARCFRSVRNTFAEAAVEDKGEKSGA